MDKCENGCKKVNDLIKDYVGHSATVTEKLKTLFNKIDDLRIDNDKQWKSIRKADTVKLILMGIMAVVYGGTKLFPALSKLM